MTGKIERINPESGVVEEKPAGVEGVWTPFSEKVTDDDEGESDDEGKE